LATRINEQHESALIRTKKVAAKKDLLRKTEESLEAYA
jgi:hypothetical protein